jgi:hypothetical protein
LDTLLYGNDEAVEFWRATFVRIDGEEKARTRKWWQKQQETIITFLALRIHRHGHPQQRVRDGFPAPPVFRYDRTLE